jgi:hypothetical protein
MCENKIFCFSVIRGEEGAIVKRFSVTAPNATSDFGIIGYCITFYAVEKSYCSGNKEAIIATCSYFSGKILSVIAFKSYFFDS